MDAYDAARSRPTRSLKDTTRASLERLALALSTGDLAAVEAALSPSAETITDAGGDYLAALRHVTGASRVARFYMALMKKVGVPSRVEVRELNGPPALVIEVDDAPDRYAPRLVVRCHLNEAGQVDRVHAILAKAKLVAVDEVRALV